VKLAIGTAQFGLSYGIANKLGQTRVAEAHAILDYAQSAEIDTLDTAIAYGNSEAVIGATDLSRWAIISKLPAFPGGNLDVNQWVRTQVEQSLKRLNRRSLCGLLLHHPGQLNESPLGQDIFKAVSQLKHEGVIEKLGISIYHYSELENLSQYHFDIVQCPYNVFDRQLETSGWLDKLVLQSTQVHVRSIFLQGLLLMPEEQRPERFKPWEMLLRQWDLWLEENRISALQACIDFVLAESRIGKVVIGVDSKYQLEQIVQCLNNHPRIAPDHLQSNDPLLVNPSLWHQQ
jgi:aryl-alcohol dehydrogenase-like predicted oxidoreductase